MLFEFYLNDEIFYYVDEKVDVGRYKSVPISCDEISKDNLNNDIHIIMNANLAPIDLYKEFNPSNSVFVRILNDDNKMLFFGRIANVEFDTKKGSAKISAKTFGGLLNTKIPKRTYSSMCGFELCDEGCALKKDEICAVLSRNSLKYSSDFLDITSAKLAEQPNGFWAGGYISFNNQFAYITKHENDTIHLMFPMPLLAKSLFVYVYPGCDKTLSCCKNRFKNEKNFGGFAFVPSKNPVTQGY